MIRDKHKIYGEPNDPNTVIATGILETDKLVVGAGNKGVKTIDNNGIKSVVTIDSTNKVKFLPINSPNKVIGTDNLGNLVLKDFPQYKLNLSSFTQPYQINLTDTYGAVTSLSLVNHITALANGLYKVHLDMNVDNIANIEIVLVPENKHGIVYAVNAGIDMEDCNEITLVNSDISSGDNNLIVSSAMQGIKVGALYNVSALKFRLSASHTINTFVFNCQLVGASLEE